MSKAYNPEMHSAEHILNSVMEKDFSVRPFSSHIERKKSKCDYRLDRPLTDSEIDSIGRQVNSIIESATDITDYFIPRTEASEKFDLSRLPEDGKDKVRIVKIGACDEYPCIGEHVSNTSQIGKFRIISSDWSEGCQRIRFKTVRERDKKSITG